MFEKLISRLLFLVCLPILYNGIARASDELIFAVMGDVPRSHKEETILQKQISEHNRLSQAEFIVHVGDIKSGGAPCADSVYYKVANYLKKSTIPVFIVPGDNEWNDCEHPDEAWKLWKKYFMRFEENWRRAPEVKHQRNRPENFAFARKRVLLIGINLVGGRVFDQAVWDKVLQDDADWVEEQFKKRGKSVRAAVVFAQANPNEKHKLFMDRFRAAVRTFRKPVLFIHGDGHKWLYDDPWLEPNLVRVQVDRGGIAPPVQVIVNPASEQPFQFNRKLFEQPVMQE